MSAFKQRLARIGASAGVLAVTTAAIMAVGGASASSALALTCPTEGAAIQGKGSSLQRVAQERWTGRVVPSGEPLTGLPHTALSPAVGYAAKCAEPTSASYTSTSSGNGLAAFGLAVGSSSIDKTIHYIGTDDGPTTAQISAAETASGGAKPLVIPVAETAIAVVVHPPTGCTFKESKTAGGITWKQLNKVFNGTITQWSGLTGQVNGGAACNSAITRVVRFESSGTTTQFKNYLSSLETTTGIKAEGPGCSLGTWASLREIGTGGAPNTTWPTCAGTSSLVTKEGGGGVAGYVASTEGTIGYAALPDAKGKSASIVRLQNFEESEEPLFGTAEGTGETSNCGERQYTVPVGGREGESGVGINWFEVFGASPKAGKTLYPICTLTYDVAWKGYATAGYTSAAKIAANVKTYLDEYVLGEGQSVAHWYQPLPQPEAKATGALHNVLGAALLSAGQIS